MLGSIDPCKCSLHGQHVLSIYHVHSNIMPCRMVLLETCRPCSAHSSLTKFHSILIKIIQIPSHYSHKTHTHSTTSYKSNNTSSSTNIHKKPIQSNIPIKKKGSATFIYRRPVHIKPVHINSKYIKKDHSKEWSSSFLEGIAYTSV